MLTGSIDEEGPSGALDGRIRAACVPSLANLTTFMFPSERLLHLRLM